MTSEESGDGERAGASRGLSVVRLVPTCAALPLPVRTPAVYFVPVLCVREGSWLGGVRGERGQTACRVSPSTVQAEAVSRMGEGKGEGKGGGRERNPERTLKPACLPSMRPPRVLPAPRSPPLGSSCETLLRACQQGRGEVEGLRLDAGGSGRRSKSRSRSRSRNSRCGSGRRLLDMHRRGQLSVRKASAQQPLQTTTPTALRRVRIGKEPPLTRQQQWPRNTAAPAPLQLVASIDTFHHRRRRRYRCLYRSLCVRVTWIGASLRATRAPDGNLGLEHSRVGEATTLSR